MTNINHKLFNEDNDILVFIKGNDHYYGYLVIQGKLPEDIDIAQTVLNINGSEFIALNKALKNIKENSFHAEHRIKVYSNNQNVAGIANGERNPDSLQSQYEIFKDLSEGLVVQVHWVPDSYQGLNTTSTLSVYEEQYAKDRLNSLSNQIAEYKEGHQKHIK